MKLLNILIFAFLLVFSISCTKDLTSGKDNTTQLRGNSSTFSPCLFENDISVESLPESILNYISINHSGIAIEEAEALRSDNSISSIEYYIVQLKNGIEVLFDMNGLFVQSQEQNGTQNENEDEHENENNDEDIILSDLNPSIIEYINTNYPSEQIKEASLEVKFSLTFIEIELNSSTLYFDESGNFLCEKSDDDGDDDHGDDDDGDDDDGDNDDGDNDDGDNDDGDNDDGDDDDGDDDDGDDDDGDNDDGDDDDGDDDDGDNDDGDDDDGDDDDGDNDDGDDDDGDDDDGDDDDGDDDDGDDDTPGFIF